MINSRKSFYWSYLFFIDTYSEHLLSNHEKKKQTNLQYFLYCFQFLLYLFIISLLLIKILKQQS